MRIQWVLICLLVAIGHSLLVTKAVSQSWDSTETNYGNGALFNQQWMMNHDDVYVTGNFQSPHYSGVIPNARNGYKGFVAINASTGTMQVASWFPNQSWKVDHGRADGMYDNAGTAIGPDDRILRFRMDSANTYENLFLARNGHVRIMHLDPVPPSYLWYENWDNWQTPGYLNGWQLSGNEKFVMGRYLGSKTYSNYTIDGVLILAPTTCAALMYYDLGGHQNYTVDPWYQPWNNACQGWIASWQIRSDDRFYAFDFDGDGIDELLCMNPSGWAMLLSYDEVLGDWNELWANGGNGWIGGWHIASNDNILIGDLNGIAGDEALFTNVNTGYAAVMRHEAGKWHTNWTNNGAGNIGGLWNINNGDRMFLYRNMYGLPDRATVMMINPGTGWYMAMNYLGLPKRTSDAEATSAETAIRVDVTPNPFVNSATVEVCLKEAGDLKVDIHDILGKRIRTIYDGMSEGGTRFFTWNALNDHGSHVPSGIYLCRIRNGNNQKIIMLSSTR